MSKQKASLMQIAAGFAELDLNPARFPPCPETGCGGEMQGRGFVLDLDEEPPEDPTEALFEPAQVEALMRSMRLMATCKTCGESKSSHTVDEMVQALPAETRTMADLELRRACGTLPAPARQSEAVN